MKSSVVRRGDDGDVMILVWWCLVRVYKGCDDSIASE